MEGRRRGQTFESQRDKEEPAKFQQKKHTSNSQVGGKPREYDVQVGKTKVYHKKYTTVSNTVNKSSKVRTEN